MCYIQNCGIIIIIIIFTSTQTTAPYSYIKKAIALHIFHFILTLFYIVRFFYSWTHLLKSSLASELFHPTNIFMKRHMFSWKNISPLCKSCNSCNNCNFCNYSWNYHENNYILHDMCMILKNHEKKTCKETFFCSIQTPIIGVSTPKKNFSKKDMF